jgi:hypothetical protein
MCSSRNGLRGIASSVSLAGAVLCAGVAQADSIRIDTKWHQNVYVVESDQFYHVLFPKDGTSKKVLKKRQDISAPRFSKDPAERAKLKEQWDAAAKERELTDAREVELRVQTTDLSNRDVPRPVTTPLSTAEIAAREATYQQVLLERQAAMEERQRLLNERAGIFPEPEPAPLAPEQGALEGESPESATPPGPRAQPEEAVNAEAQAEQERMQAEPYFNNQQDQYYYEQQRNQEQERMQAEAYYWQEEAQQQGYVDPNGLAPATPLVQP